MRTNKRNKPKRSSRTNERSRPGEAEAKFTLAVRRIAREACAPTWHAFTATRIFQSVSPGSARVTGWQTTRDAHTRHAASSGAWPAFLARRHASVGEWGFLAAWLVAQAAVGRRRSVQGAGLDELEFSKYPA